MKNNILRKLLAKVTSIVMLLTMFAPLSAGIVKADTADLNIGVNISSGGFTLISDATVDGNPIYEIHKNALDAECNHENGYYVCDFNNLPLGGYDIVFDDATGYLKPADVALMFTHTTTLLNDYVSPGGNLNIGVNIASGAFTVISDATDSSGSPIYEIHKNATDPECNLEAGYYTCDLNGLPTGGYDIVFDEATGYLKPADVAVMLSNTNLVINRDYISPGGNLNIGVNIASGAFTVISDATDSSGSPIYEIHKNATDPECNLEAGYYTCDLNGLPTGGYDIVFDEATGYLKPADVALMLSESGATINRDYLSSGGNLTVGVNIASGGFTITSDATVGGNPAFETHRYGSECDLENGYYQCDFNGLETGGYDIVFDDALSYVTPGNVALMLGNEGAEILRFYSSFPSGTVQVQIIDEYGVEITNVPTGHWELRSCTSENPASCDSVSPEMTGGPSSTQNELQYSWYRLFVDSTPLSGYAYADIFNTVNTTPAVELTSNTDYVVFTIQYHEPTITPTEIEIRAKKDGTLSPVDYIYCIGDVATPSALACEAVQTTIDTIQAISDTSTEQGIFVHREAGFQTPYNEDVGASALAQDAVVTGFEDYYYYSIAGEELADERITMVYNQVPPEAVINVAIEGPSAMVSAEVSISGGVANHVSINNGNNQDFPVNSSINYVVTCHDVADYFTLTPTIAVDNLSVTETRNVVCRYANDVAFVNLGSLTNEATPQPLKAQAVLVVTDPAGTDNQTQVTTVVDTNGTDAYYRLSRDTDSTPNDVDNRFVLETDVTGYTPNVDGYVQCLPAPGGFHAPNNVLQINNLHILTGEEEFAGLCEYYEVPAEDQVDITIDTIGVEKAAIYVDGVEVRVTDDSDEVTVTITTEETHTITFEDKTPATFRTPNPIVIPAGTLNSTMSPHYLGYYVELGHETVVEIDTMNENGFVYMTLSPSDTQYMVGYATTVDTITVVVDNRNYHEFSFQDRNLDIPPYVLRAVPAAGCSVVTNTADTLSTTVVGSDTIVVRFQEYYVCDGSTTVLPALVTLTGHYIAKANAAFFRAKTTNTEVDINGDITTTLGEPNTNEVLHPGSNTFTLIFVSDVENDTDDQVVFESPITVVAQDYIADPTNYQLTDFAPSETLNELTSTYVLDEGLVDVSIRLVSFDPLVQPTEGLDVVMDNGGMDETTESTVLDGTDIEAQFENVDSTSAHVFECPTIVGLNPPNTVIVPAGTMSDSVENVFYCLYSSTASGAEIQILTTANDEINLVAPITLEVDGTDYAIGYTNGSEPTTEANMELWVESTLTNTIKYGDVAGYVTPENQTVSVAAGTSYLDYGTDPATNPNIFVGLYTRGGTISVYTMDEVTAAVDGVDDSIIMLTNLTDATTAVELVGAGGTGYIENVQVDANANYMISFGSHPTDAEYATPLPIYFNLSDGDVRSYLGVYVKNECQADLRREDINTGDALSAEIMLSVGGGTEYSLGTGNPTSDYLVSFLIDQTQANDTYEFRFVPLPAPLDIVNPPTLGLPTDGMTCPVAQTIYYGTDDGANEAEFVITLLEQTANEDPVPNTTVTLNSADVETSDTLGQVTFTDVAVDGAITFSFADHSTNPTGFVTPLDLTYPADAFASGETHELTVYYVPADCVVTLDISTVDESNTSINVNGEISLQTNAGPINFTGAGTAIVNVCFNDSVDVIWGPAADTAAYALPAINPKTIDFTGVAAGETMNVLGLYRPIGIHTPLNFTVQAEDQNNNELNPTFTYGGVPGTSTHSFQVMYEDLDNYTISFNDLNGYVTPANVVVTNRVVTVPSNVTVTVNGLAYVAGTELQEGNAVVILATYNAAISVEKTVTTENIINNNIRANYTVLVTNNSGDDIEVTLHDTISDTGGALFGNNGGTMTVVTQNGKNTVCYNPADTAIPLPTCPDVVSADQTFTVGNTPVMITYQLLSNNSGIPTGQSSTFTNTASATFTDGAEITVDADARAVVSGPPGGGVTPPGGGGGGGGGGGHVLIKGDMELEVEKLVSLDGTNYVDASDQDSALGMPKNRDSKVYVKVRLTNVGKVSAVNIEYQQAFEEGDSAMTARDPQNVEGADGYDENTKIIEVDLIPVNGTHEFTYEIMVNEKGSNGEYAREEIELLGFESRLPTSQDFMTYMGIGGKYPSYLIAGEKQGNVSQDEFLRITVESDIDEANIGDIVNFLVTAENISDMDLTGLMIAHNYDENALEILNVFGGRDNGREVEFSRAILRPGEIVTFQIQAKVGGNAPVGKNVYGITRALVDQSDGVAPVRNSIYIIGGVNLADTGVVRLAQTGPGMILILLLASLLAYLSYSAVTRQKYAMVKRAALRPL